MCDLNYEQFTQVMKSTIPMKLEFFLKLLPDRTLKFRNEKCVGGKLSKERITSLVCANMTGTDKRKLLVIGKAKRLRCFKNVKALPVNYQANARSWMTSAIFEEEIRKWGKQLSKTQKKILLLIDNCPAHPNLDNLTNIKLVFLPPNSTSVLQPMDQGIIRSLKCHYRKLLLKKIIVDLEDNNQHITLLDAVDLLERAWREISSSTIANCFRHSKLSENVNENETVDDEDDIPLSELVKQWNSLRASDEVVSTEHIDIFMDVDNCLVTSEFLTDAEIVAEVQSANETEAFEEQEEDSEEETPTLREAVQSVKVLKRYYRSCDTSNAFVDKLNVIENDLDKQFWKLKTVQKKYGLF